VKLPSLVRLPKHKRFEFQPRHYDPIKEELEERIEKIKREHKAATGSNPDYVSTGIKFERANQKNRFEIGIQLYLVVFMLFDLFLLFKVDNLSNQSWLIILILQITVIYLKVRMGKKKKLK